MFNFGAFAGGLAQGIRSGGEMGFKGRLAERAAKADERAAEMHHARMDKAASNKDQRDRLRAANDEIAAGWREALQPSRPMATSPDQLRSDSARLFEPTETGLVLERPHGQFSTGELQSKSAARTESGATASLDGAGLMSQYKNPPQAPIAADEMIGRRMLAGNLLEDADELTRMASIYKKHGLLKEMAPWMNKAYEAKKKRIPDALHFLLTGDAKAAREVLRKGGISLIDDPVPTDPNDPQNHHWKFKLENGGEQDINLKELSANFFPSSIFSQ